MIQHDTSSKLRWSWGRGGGGKHSWVTIRKFDLTSYPINNPKAVHVVSTKAPQNEQHCRAGETMLLRNDMDIILQVVHKKHTGYKLSSVGWRWHHTRWDKLHLHVGRLVTVVCTLLPSPTPPPASNQILQVKHGTCRILSLSLPEHGDNNQTTYRVQQ